MNKKTKEELLDKTQRNSSHEYISVVNCLAAMGDPVSCVVDAIYQAMNGNQVNILAVIIKAEKDFGDEYGNEEFFKEIWYNFSGRERTFSQWDDIGDFLMMLANAFATGEDNFPKSIKVSNKLAHDAMIYTKYFM
ncbi:hypothetical protein [Succiniclasticum ruminis]|uniref:Uncharacterized protein n=1 Tax=Succiniclasticum ruminis DSM 9236 TaxID=1123323 RepID=A0A1I1YEA5_9FIRM|nr:hypothetical protein [Succiniclasticum ruminis]SFE17927.1 hypothetical protein SAMN05216245_102167 [Succiniclasticum ruminis DSM 9236]